MASMTKMHFRALADALASENPQASGRFDDPTRREAATLVWERTVRAVAAACGSFNGAFDSGRFYEACGFFPLARGYGRAAWRDYASHR